MPSPLCLLSVILWKKSISLICLVCFTTFLSWQSKCFPILFVVKLYKVCCHFHMGLHHKGEWIMMVLHDVGAWSTCCNNYLHYDLCIIMFYWTIVAFKGSKCFDLYTPAQRSWRGVYWIHLVRLSVCPSVCRRHGFWSISLVCFRISISNFKCLLMVAISRSLLIFSDVTFKMAAWRPY